MVLGRSQGVDRDRTDRDEKEEVLVEDDEHPYDRKVERVFEKEKPENPMKAQVDVCDRYDVSLLQDAQRCVEALAACLLEAGQIVILL